MPYLHFSGVEFRVPQGIFKKAKPWDKIQSQMQTYCYPSLDPPQKFTENSSWFACS